VQAFHLNPPTAVSEIPATETWQFGKRQLNSVYPIAGENFVAIGETLRAHSG